MPVRRSRTSLRKLLLGSSYRSRLPVKPCSSKRYAFSTSTADSEAIVAELLGGLELPVRERITSAAEGNPLYVEQITAMLVDNPRRYFSGAAA